MMERSWRTWLVSFALGGICLLLVLALDQSYEDQEGLRQAVGQAQKQLRQLQEQVSRCEAGSATSSSSIGGAVIPAPQPTPPPALAPRAPMRPSAPATPPDSRLVDQPSASRQYCEFATIRSNAKLASGLTWDPSRGGRYVADLPAGTIVEVLNPALTKWNDYPDEHALLVRVVESKTAPQIVGESGYIELRQIDHRRCNLGAEFDK